MTQAVKKPEAAMPDRFLEFTISGNYYNSKKELIDFEYVVGKIPFCDEENKVGSMHVRGRFAEKWVKDAVNPDGTKKYPERIHKMHQTSVDNVQLTTGTLSFVGKDIKNLSIDEMQDLAVAKDLRLIPIPNSGYSKSDMLIRAYVAYSEKVLLTKIKYQEEDFNFFKLPSIILTGELRQEKHKKFTNDEIIAKEQEPTKSSYGEKDDPKKRWTMEQLVEAAAVKNITLEKGLSFDEVYSKLFPST